MKNTSQKNELPHPVPPEIQDEQLLGINKEPAHATLVPYATLTQALDGDRDMTRFSRLLNGNWKFHWVDRPETRPVDFFRPDFDDSAWNEIPVPSNWQLHGYGTPYYRNLGYTFQVDPPRVMSEPPREYTAYEERNPVGSYRRTFEIPAAWNGRQVFITFDGVDAGFFLWVNGEKIGYSVNSRNPAGFNITRHVHFGEENLLAVEVYRYTAGSYLEDQDMWRLSGIFRNVRLWSAAPLRIRDMFVRGELDPNCIDGALDVTVTIRNDGTDASHAQELSVSLYHAESQKQESLFSIAVPAIAAGSEAVVSRRVAVPSPRQWSAEDPYLYTTVLQLGEELVSCRTGFRRIEIRGRVFMINGVPVKLKGANRHEHWPDTGHVVTEERMIRDIEILKQCNCNHVRTAHYSDDPRWYELCDEFGIYLVAEANVECHGLMDKLDCDPRWEKAIIERNVANVQNLKNHPCVVIWSLGNENGGGSNFVAATAAVKAIDTSRPVHYERFGIGSDNPAADVDSRMYTHPDDVLKIATGDATYTKPFYLCEYAHAMNNSMGAIGEYNDLFDAHPALMGGAIWEWQDQGLWNRRDPQRPILAYGGGFGEFPNDHYFIHKGVVFSNRSPKPHYPEVKCAYQWIGIEAENIAAGKVRIRNKYAFTNLEKFEWRWEVTAFSDHAEIVASGDMEPLNLAPGDVTVVTLPVGEILARSDSEYYLRASFTLRTQELWASAGHEVASAQFHLPLDVRILVEERTPEPETAIEFRGNLVSITSGNTTYEFDSATGQLVSILLNGRNLLLDDGGPRLHLWRASHKIDDDWADKEWTDHGLKQLDWKLDSLDVQEAAVFPIIRAVMQGAGFNGFTVRHEATYTLMYGALVVRNSVEPAGPRIPLARMGVRMLFDKSLDQFTYFGRGPMENYCDRKRGSDMGIWSSTVAEQLTPYEKPMECGNHEDVVWATLRDSSGTTLRLSARGGHGPLQVSALPYTDEELEKPEYRIDLPPPRATVVCVSHKTLGVGTNSCGPRPIKKYMLWSNPATFAYAITVNGK